MIKEMFVYFDTVRRKRPVKEGGELVKLDWATKTVVKKLPIYPSDPDVEHDPNPRGNSRGGKGIIVKNDKIFVGNYHTILVYDTSLNLEYKISNPLFSNIHEMCFAGENIWVSATTLDCAISVDQAGNTLKTWWPREDAVTRQRYELSSMDLDLTADNRLAHLHSELERKDGHTHLNSVVHDDGKTYALLNSQGVFVQIEPETKVVVEDPKLRGAHSPVVDRRTGLLMVCGTFSQDILFYNLDNGELVRKIHLLDFEPIAKLYEQCPDQKFNKSIFVRGLEILDESRVLVGISPAAVLEVDVNSNKLLDMYQHSSEVGDAVHGLVHLKK